MNINPPDMHGRPGDAEAGKGRMVMPCSEARMPTAKPAIARVA
jgi:hypothetical protein